MAKELLNLDNGTICSSWNYSDTRLATGSVDGTLSIFDLRDPTSSSSSLRSTFKTKVLAKKKAIEQLIKAANSKIDQLTFFPSYRHFKINGLSVCLNSGHGNKLSSPVKRYIQNLLKLNMEGPYGSEWQEEEKVKRREMVDPEARYIFVHEVVNSNADDMTTVLTEEDTSTSRQEDSGPLVGFVHYRFVLEEDVPVLYVYELQLESCVQGKGLGKFLMELIELIAQKVLNYFSQPTLASMIVENCCYVAEDTTYNL